MKVEEAEQGSTSPENASSVSSSKKRKHEEATPEEKHELFLHSTKNPHLKQRELAEWFELTFHKAINQSTVSRNLKKFKASLALADDPTTGSNNQNGPPATPTPSKKQQKQQKQDQAKEKEQGKEHQQPEKEKEKEKVDEAKKSPTQISVPIRSPPRPPTPPVKREDEEAASSAELGKALHEWYSKQSDKSSINDDSIKAKTEEINLQLHPDEKTRKSITNAWLCSWKLKHAIIQPGAPVSPEIESRRKVEEGAEGDKDRDEDEEMKSEDSISSTASTPPPRPGESEEKRRRKEIKRLRKDIEKRDIQVAKAMIRKEASLRRLEELEKENTTAR
ncbi:hypothetical protein L873DRAFT_1766432 [Choiromyces venosus 120613-1]|uniref:ARS-binding protein 1 N-terminal domain-containing protein n=1 Tax=Choiromyces venosus 120613-1 TaxID=1336337 RepID=A0A3N4JRP4_9PEZI|nr:hypothetical protein L873DRAFT_1766432 [Choiromyces venosus 120613-1]